MSRSLFIVLSEMKLDLTTMKVQLGEVKKTIGEAAKTLEGTFYKTSRGLNSMGASLAMLAGGAMAGVLYGFKKLTDYGGDLADLGKQLGMGTAALSELKYAAGMSGIELQDLAKSIAIMQKNMGSGSSESALKRLGLDLKEISAMAPEDAFTAIVDALGKVQGQAERMSLAQAIFGKGGGSMLRLADDGAKGIKELRDEARKAGVSISEEQSKMLDEIGDKWDGLKGNVSGLATSFLVSLAPSINAALDVLRSFTNQVMKLVSDNRELVSGIVKTAFAGLAFATGLGFMALGLGRVIIFTADAIGAFRRLMTINWAVAASNVASVASLVAFAAALALVGMAIAMWTSKPLNDYVRNMEWARKMSDFLFVSWINGWENLKFSTGQAMDFIVTQIKDKLLAMKSFITDVMAQLLDLGGAAGFDGLSKTADTLRQKSIAADQARRESMAGFDARSRERAENRDRRVSDVYDSSIFGEAGRSEYDQIRAQKAVSAGSTDSALLQILKESLAENRRQTEELQALRNRGIGLNKMDTGFGDF